MTSPAPWIRPCVERAAGLVALCVLLELAAPDAACAAEPAISPVTSTVTKVAVLRHRLGFRPSSDEFAKPPDEYLGFLEGIKTKDVVGVYLLYNPSLSIAPIGSDPRSMRIGRLRATYKPMEAWLTERSLDASIVDIDGSALNPMISMDFDAVTVEVLLKRR